MVTLLAKGTYRIIETKHLVRILRLDTIDYAWITTENIGEILVATHNPHKTDYVIVASKYRLYKVASERKLHPGFHLELNVGNGGWQGYILPNGLPSDTKKRVKIYPTTEIITKGVS